MLTSVIKYTVVKSKDQYIQYCEQLEKLLDEVHSDQIQDEIDLLTVLIEKHDQDHNTCQDTDPIIMLRSFMEEHHMKPQDLINVLGISKGYISDILNYKKGLSKSVIRKLADYFKVKQEAFNRPYKLM